MWPNPHVAQYTNGTEKKYTSVDTNGETVEGPFNNRMPTDVLAINHYQTSLWRSTGLGASVAGQPSQPHY